MVTILNGVCEMLCTFRTSLKVWAHLPIYFAHVSRCVQMFMHLADGTYTGRWVRGSCLRTPTAGGTFQAGDSNPHERWRSYLYTIQSRCLPDAVMSLNVASPLVESV